MLASLVLDGRRLDAVTTSPDLAAIERQYRAGQISHREIGRQHGRSESWVRKLAKRNGWTRDLAGAVRNRVRESLVREGSRQSELIGIKPSDAAIIDEAAAIGVAVVRSHRQDINALRVAAAGLLGELGLELKITDRSRVICDLSAAMARLVPLERQAFGLDEVNPDGGVISVEFEQRLVRARLRVGHTQDRHTLED